MQSRGHTLEMILSDAARLRPVRKSDLTCGDRIIVKTANSIYSIRILDEKTCVVTGGWFDKKGLSPVTTRVVGCTWGGTAIKMDIIAACGLCLEFGNRLVTTPIRKILILPHWLLN